MWLKQIEPQERWKMTNQVMTIIIMLIISNFLIAISKVGNDNQKRVKMTLIWNEWVDGRYITTKTKTIYDTDYQYDINFEEAKIVLHNDSEILGLKKGKYGLIKGEFVERLN